MTTGALIFAFNNDEIDYVNLARWSADNIHRHLDIPVCLVTNQEVGSDIFDKVIIVENTKTDSTRYFDDVGSSVTWYNHDRVDAWSVTPWDKTLVLDADYVVASDALRDVLKSGFQFVCHDTAYDLSRGDFCHDLNKFGRHDMPMWWATVMMFDRSRHAESIFNIMRMVRDNWTHYRHLYGIKQRTYRNDHALSIAMNIMSGHTLQSVNIPWPLMSIMPDTKLTQVDLDTYRLEYTTPDQKKKYHIVRSQDFHAMGKRYLGDIIANQS